MCQLYFVTQLLRNRKFWLKNDYSSNINKKLVQIYCEEKIKEIIKVTGLIKFEHHYLTKQWECHQFNYKLRTVKE